MNWYTSIYLYIFNKIKIRLVAKQGMSILIWNVNHADHIFSSLTNLFSTLYDKCIGYINFQMQLAYAKLFLLD